MQILIPRFSLVLLIGTSGSGKSTFAQKHFQPTEVVSSDRCRALISDDENDQTVTPQAFRLLRLLVEFRLCKRRLTVVDATNVQSRSRLPLLALAREHGASPVAIVFDLPEAACLDRNTKRPERVVPGPVIARQQQDFRRALQQLNVEGFTVIYVLNNGEEIENATIIRGCALVSSSVVPAPKKGLWQSVLTRISRLL